MEIALIALGVCGLVLVPSFVFLLIVQPLWAVIEVCGSAILGRGRRIVWLLMLLVFATVASVPYAIFGAASGVLRKVTIACLVLTSLAVAAGYGVFAYHPRLKEQLLASAREAIGKDALYREVLGYAKALGADKDNWIEQLARLSGD